MCGIYGVFGSGIVKEDLNIFYNLAFMNQMRGMHSTGVLRLWKQYGKPKIDSGQEYRTEIRKDTVCAQDFYGRKENDAVLSEMTPVAIMGHNRHATVGAQDDINGAHPFENERYIGFHNGTLRDDKFTKDTGFLTDSEALWDALAKAPDPKKVLETLDKDSAFALAYFDKNSGRIGFVRNEKRPLYFAVHQRRNVVYYSSERAMLEFVLDRFDVDYSGYALGPWKSIMTKPEQLQFLVKKYENSEKTYRVNSWFIKELDPKPPEPKVVPINSRVHYGTNWTSSRKLECVGCTEDLEGAWATYNNKRDPKDNPVHIPCLGLVCSTCYEQWMVTPKEEEPAKPAVAILN